MAFLKKKQEPKIEEKDISFENKLLNAFVNKMNEKTADLGLTNTAFKNPTGTIAQGLRNLSTTDDMVKMLINACSYPELMRIWNKKNKIINIYGRNPRKITVKTNLQNEEFEKEYFIMGGKTGSQYTSKGNMLNLALICVIQDKIVAASIAGAKDEASRWSAMRELLDICTDKIRGLNAEDKKVEMAECASACIIPSHQATFAKYPFKFLYSQNGSKIIVPSGITKVMTAIIALEWIKNIHDDIKILPLDADMSSENLFGPDDVLMLEDIIHAMLLSSSNQAAKAIARYSGEFILRKNQQIVEPKF